MHRRNLVKLAPQHRPKHIDNNIHPIALALGVTREQLGRLLGVTHATLINWITDRRTPPALHRAALARMLHAVENNDTARLKALRALARANDEHSDAIVQTTLAILFHQL
jgi:DNA-binding transcriptional regulator YiaG